MLGLNYPGPPFRAVGTFTVQRALPGRTRFLLQTVLEKGACHLFYMLRVGILHVGRR